MKRRVITTAAVLGAVLALGACGGGDAADDEAGSGQVGSCSVAAGPMAFVVGNRANTPAIGSSPPAALVGATESAVAHESSTLLVDTGGRPQVQSISLTLEGKNDAARQAEQNEKTTALQAAILATKATAPEANPLEALNLAADHLRANGGGGTVVMVDSGLGTTGALDYTQAGMLEATGEDVAASLKSAGQLPDLTGATVVLIGLGSTADPQQALDTATRHTLQAQWEALAKAAGAACVAVDTTPTSGASVSGVPTVTTVTVPEATADIPTATKPTELSLQFQSNSDQFVDSESAKAALTPIATWLKDSGTAVLLTGTSASDGDEAGQVQISTMRAEAVKAALVELGASADQISTEGVGTNSPTHVNDLDANGNLLPGPAAQNRLVIVSIKG